MQVRAWHPRLDDGPHYDGLAKMWQSITIFIVIMLFRAVVSALAKKAQAQKEAQAKATSTPAARRVPVEPVARKALPIERPARAVRPVRIDPPVRAKPVVHDAAPIHAVALHAAEGEATAKDLAATVRAIHDGILRKPAQKAKVSPRNATTDTAHAQLAARRMLGSAMSLRRAVITQELLAPPIALRN